MKQLLIALYTTLFFISCNENKSNCDGSTICTREFVYVNLEVVGNLDSAFVTNQETGIRKETDLLDPQYAPNYVIASDGEKDISFDGTAFSFEGWAGGKIAATAEFLIGKDCCHIFKISGPEEIPVN